ncbi:hypothetical protein L249_3073 [Ophiocordyceps polyrhachis-furcata BCC 54312]|uniref:Alpha-1,2 mannosyltransferase KTR1 n=1 Tax=Ophiocordyceps polyrhachis-furcata BCC 54312 TaxID=1330021 RepID=A0A367LR98_9HYPO|nr:hypothetical protein L249_3073 [Ophiocordyceps polyrhachis-furcata BCC 54312]
MNGGRGVNSVPGLFLALWAWCFMWYCYCLSPAAATSTDHPPRAVLVSFARETDLPAVLSSVSQLEETFNNRYRYDWVFFSTSPLSEDFRRLTSNATAAACVYEVINDELWSVPEGASDSTLQTVELEMEPESSSAFARQMRRWKSGRFAKESRLKSYDWFWTIEPGVSISPAQFIHDIDFDVFRVMRDHGIAYGSHDSGLNEAYMRRLSQHVKSFVDDNPDLTHEEADVSWLLEAAESVSPHGQGGATDDALVVRGDGMTLDDADGGWLDDGEDEEDVGSPIEVLASRLGGIYRSSLWPTFEVGSLVFLRSQSHQSLLEHLDRSDALLDSGGTPTLSASLFLPQKSVLHFRKRENHGADEPQSTAKPKFSLVRVVGSDVNRSDSLQRRRVKAFTAERWELMAEDFGRQGGMPGLRSGNTVFDGRGFTMLGFKHGVVAI